jgi:predicted amidohydrolase
MARLFKEAGFFLLPSPTMRLGIVQNAPTLGAVKKNLAACLDLMEGRSADLWVLPELFASGYNFQNKKELAACAEAVPGPLTTFLGEYARARQCAIVAGFPEKAGKKLYNSAVLVSPKKTRVYRKTHLFGGEKKLFSPGDTGFWVEKVAGVPVGVMVCFDWFFPESARTLALAGAQVIAHPANLVLPWGPDGMKIRSLENRVFSATANRVGTERGLRFIGRSQVVAPNGDILYQAPEDRPAVSVIEIEPWTAKDKRVHAANDLFADRRPRLYR